jgi:hypothetical protein
MTILRLCMLTIGLVTLGSTASAQVFRFDRMQGTRQFTPPSYQATPVPIAASVFITLENRSKVPIRTALRYKDDAGRWVTSEWYVLNPGQKKTVARTSNTIAYAYAESTLGEHLVWSGKDRSYTIENSKTKYGFREYHRSMRSPAFSVTFTQ